MKQCQRWTSWGVASLSLALLCGSARGETATDGNWSFGYSDSDFTATITGYSGTATSITIPQQVSRTVGRQEQDDDGEWHTHYRTYQYTVKGIGNYAFSRCTNLTSVIIPDSVTSIGYRAFFQSSGLTSVTIPNSVTSIGNDAFCGCSGLTNVTIPDSVTSIGDYVFDGCRGLTSLTIGDSVTSIGTYAFSGCRGLTSVTIPDSVTRIGFAAFSGCSGLTSLTIGDSVTSIGDAAFSGCSSMSFISTGNGLTSLAKLPLDSLKEIVLGNGFTSIGTDAFRGCSGLTSVTIPGSVTNIGFQAFYGCSSLTSVTVPDSVTSIGKSAFEDCNSLAGVTIPDSVTSIGTAAFCDCSSLTSVTIPGSVTNLGGAMFYGCSGLTSVTIPDSVTNLGDSMFYGCSGLTSVTIPDSVTNIEGFVFYGCSGLTSVTIPDGVTSIGKSAFENCSSLTSVAIPDSVTSIGKSTFSGCSSVAFISTGNGLTSLANLPLTASLKEIVIGNGFTSIGRQAFSGCSGLTSVTIPASVTNIGYSAFENCSSLTSVTIPDSVTSLGNSAFSGCSGLTSVTIPNSITDIGIYTFYGCNSLTSVTIPDSVMYIGYSAFENCSGLTGVTIPDGVTSIANTTFRGCSGLTSVTIPDSVTSIEDYAFKDCIGLTSVTIPVSVTHISGAFSGCSGLTSVSISDSVKNIGGWTFQYCSGLTSVTIPDSVTYIGEYAFEACSQLEKVWFKGAPPNADKRTSFLGVPAGARGYYTAAHAEEWKGVIDKDGKWCGLIMEQAGTCTLTFDANGGTGIMEGETVFIGATVTLLVNEFKNENSLFAGWAKTPDGEVVYKDEDEVKVEGDMTLYAVWKPVGGEIQLWVDRADPAEGSLTLAWEEEGADGICISSYSIYRGAGSERLPQYLVASDIMDTTWKDEEYWKAEPVLEPLNYWVVAKGNDGSERESDCLETRHRLGVFVGFSDYSLRMRLNGKPLPQSARDAEKLRDLFVKHGGMNDANALLLTNSLADLEGVTRAIVDKVEAALPGDIFVFYIATHGAWFEGDFYDQYATVQLYDKLMTMTELFGALGQFNSGVLVIPIIMACHSGAFANYSVGGGTAARTRKSGFTEYVDAGLAMCRANMPVLASCGLAENSAAFDMFEYSDFGEAFFHYGWEKGYADGVVQGLNVPEGNGDGFVSFLELIQYAKGFARGLSDDESRCSHVDWTKGHNPLLARVYAGRVPDGVVRREAPEAPQALVASRGRRDSRIELFWGEVDGADWYCVYRLKDGKSGEREEDWHGLAYRVVNPSYQDKSDTEAGKEYQYRVHAVNGAGVSGPSPVASGTRGTTAMIDWLIEKGLELGTDIRTMAELAASPSANGVSLEGCYVSGIDPLDPNAAFEAELVREDGKWKAKPVGGEKEGRVYRVEGKRDLCDDEEWWEDVTDVEDLEAEGWRFFRVRVELDE